MPPDATPPFPIPPQRTPPQAGQIRAARALLRLEQGELARRAGVSVATLRRLEGGEAVSADVCGKVVSTLERAGAEFIPQGVRLHAPEPEDRKARKERLMAIARESAARQARHPNLLTEADLYDENGLPR